MNEKIDLSKVLHDLKSKCVSLKGAADLFRDCSAPEKKEMLALMNEAVKSITESMAELSKAA